MADAQKDIDLEAQAVAELLKEAGRGKEREKTLGAGGWVRPTGRPNKLFIGRSVASALRQTRYAEKGRSASQKKEPSNSSKDEAKEKFYQAPEKRKMLLEKRVASKKEKKKSGTPTTAKKARKHD